MTLVRKEVFWLKLTISVYVICLLRLESECVLLACVCQEATTVGWGIPQGGPKVWPVLLAFYSQSAVDKMVEDGLLYICVYK